MSTSTAVTISVCRVMPRSSAVCTRTAGAWRNAIAVAKAIYGIIHNMINQQLKGNFYYQHVDGPIKVSDNVFFTKSGAIRKGTHAHNQLPISYYPLDIAWFENAEKEFTILGDVRLLREPGAFYFIDRPIWLIRGHHLKDHHVLGNPIFIGIRLKIQHMKEWGVKDRVLNLKFSEPKDFLYLSNYILLVMQVISLYMNQPAILKYGNIDILGENPGNYQFFLYDNLASGGVYYEKNRLCNKDFHDMSSAGIEEKLHAKNCLYLIKDISTNGDGMGAINTLVDRLMAEENRKYIDLVWQFAEDFFYNRSHKVSIHYGYESFKRLLKIIIDKDRPSKNEYKDAIKKLYDFYPICDLFDNSNHFNDWVNCIKGYRDTRTAHLDVGTSYYDPFLDNIFLNHSQFVFRIIFAVFFLNRLLELPRKQLGQVINRSPFQLTKKAISVDKIVKFNRYLETNDKAN